MSIAPLTAMLEPKVRVDYVRWLSKCYVGGEEMVGKAICWRGLILKENLKIIPSPVWITSTAEKAGLIFGIQYM